jgi:glycosyltransferase involved in cell wall biosynthesis
MRIAFDAKRAFQNNTGLGHYSRTLISSLIQDFPQHHYYLAAPKQTGMYVPPDGNVQMITPVSGIAKAFKSLWRSNWVKSELKQQGIDLYHGLSHEIPVGIGHTGIKAVVTMHDLIFERYPHQYKAVDVAIYRKKFRYACTHADSIIAISQQTKQDLIDYYNTPAEKISVCYQACNPIFSHQHTQAEKDAVKKKYNLPAQFFLYVGTIIERKNLLNICKALQSLGGTIDIPLVVIGGGSENDSYYRSIRTFVKENGLEQKVVFLSENATAKQDEAFKSAADFPAIYQSALAMIYPSVFEGFGLPVLEALWSQTPVITSNISCLPETGGDAALYVDPYSYESIATAMQQVYEDENLRKAMIEKGIAHAQQFTTHTCAAKVVEVYQSLF